MPPRKSTVSKADAVADKVHDALDKVAEQAPVTPKSQVAKLPAAKKTVAAAKKAQSKIHASLHFPLAVALSFALASLGYSLVGELSKGELASVSRSQETWEEVGVLAGWRLIELAVGWFGNFDSLDVAMIDLLSHGPTVYLLSTFYNLSPVTALSALFVDVLSAALPFYLLRPLSAVHKGAKSLPNRELIDPALQLYTVALSTGIYTVTLVLSLRFLLPRILVLHFSGLPSLEPAYTASYIAVLPVTLLFGAAASTFIFPPFATTGKVKEDDKIKQFNPVEATLGQTVRWNFWGYTAKSKVVIGRTAATMLVTGINTYLACSKTIYGVESTGAIAYASVWVFAALCTGLGLGLVGGE